MKTEEEEEEDKSQIDCLHRTAAAKDAVDVKGEEEERVPVKTEEEGAVKQEEVTLDLSPKTKDFRVKMEEVEDEDMPSAPNSKVKPEDLTDHSNVDMLAFADTTNTSADVEMNPIPAHEREADPGVRSSTVPLTSLEDDLAFGFAVPDFNDADDDDDLLDLDAINPRVKSPKPVASHPPPGPGPSSFDLMPPPASTRPLAEQRVKEGKAADPDLESPWNSVGQLVAFRESSIAIGDNYLKSQGIKLKKARKRPSFHFNNEQGIKFYKQGKKDAQKIDVRRKRIKGANDD